jgi:hypothetical protein
MTMNPPFTPYLEHSDKSHLTNLNIPFTQYMKNDIYNSNYIENMEDEILQKHGDDWLSEF